MKVRALITQHGSNGRIPAGEVFEVSERKYKELREKRIKKGKKPLVKKVHTGFSKRKTKDTPSKYTYEQSGSWFTIYEGDKEIDKFQGKDGLKKYGLYEPES